jgi:hypothetical protein
MEKAEEGEKGKEKKKKIRCDSREEGNNKEGMGKLFGEKCLKRRKEREMRVAVDEEGKWKAWRKKKSKSKFTSREKKLKRERELEEDSNFRREGVRKEWKDKS